MSVMNNKEFIEKLKHITNLATTYYSVAGGDWAKWNGKSWNFDCIILIKAILWGWNENKNHAHGGATYGSNGVYDDGTEQLINRCSNVSTDFSNMQEGELLWMNGHVGIYIGNGEVIECTAAWQGGVLYSKIDNYGNRTRNGSQVYKWQKHGKLPYIEYIVENNNPLDNKTNEELAKEVIEGKYGNGEDRKNALGSRYSEVQALVNEMLAPKVTYLSNKSYNGVSIVDALNQIGVDSSFNYRSKLANSNGINNYTGTAEQNIFMLSKLQNGTLKSV